MRARILFGEISELSEYKRTADSLIATRDTTIENCKAKTSELKQGIAQLQIVNREKSFQYKSLEEEMRHKKKIWRRRFLIGIGGGGVAGLLMGVLIAK